MEVQIAVPHINGGAYGFAGSGKVEYSCTGKASTYTLSDCHQYTELVDYRAVGVFVVTWEGANYPDSFYSPAEAWDEICG